MRFLISAIAVAAVAVLAAGCGGGSSTAAAGTAQASGTLAYVHCMRSHGVPNFPGPNSSGEVPKDKIIALVNGPQFRVADNDCRHLISAGGLGPAPTAQETRARFAAALAFARCVRAHGFRKFPDPTATGQLTLAMVAAAGINVHQPAALQAADACVGVSHGFLTKAAVARALSDNGNGGSGGSGG
jgi:hypothetical protein